MSTSSVSSVISTKSMQQTLSKFDQIFRSILISKFFSDGWGQPDVLLRMFQYRHNLTSRERCAELADLKDNPIRITHETTSSNLRIINGQFRSPLDVHQPNILEPPNDTAVFQLIEPANVSQMRLRPAVIHLAMTGDHGFAIRRSTMAEPLARESQVTSIILENPFYGARKPKKQYRSCLRNVTDLFAMGGCLMLECHLLLQWLRSQGYGPLGVTGISLGGHMASLAGGCYNKPVSVIPCLSWSTASQVWTEGVLAGALPWSKLIKQFHEQKFAQTIPEKPGDYVGFSVK